MASLRIARLIVYPVGGEEIKTPKWIRDPNLTRAETGTIDDWLRLFSLQADIKFKIVDIEVETFGHLRDLRVRVPFQEARISWKEMESTRCFKTGYSYTHV